MGTGTTDRRWVPFDGLRAVLVAGVMAHHAEWTLGDATPLFEAGWLPVDGFFVLSGFLITDALRREFAARGTIDVAGFLARRLARIYPALLLALAGIAAIALVADDRPFDDVWPSLASAASLGHNLNYGSVSPILTEVGPFWSLGVELQFYVVFPFVALGLLLARAPRAVWVMLLVAIVAMSAISRSVLGVERYPDSYMWTPVRLDAIAWGSMLALASGWAWLVRVPQRAVRVSSLVAVGALVWIYLNLGPFDARTYDWGITAVGVSSAIVVAALLVLPSSAGARALSWGPLVAVGRRSYAAYLWHQAVFLFLKRHTGPGRRFGLGGDPDWLVGLGVAGAGFVVTFALADLTYRFVERPAIAWSRRWTAKARRPATPQLDSIGFS